MVQALPMWYLIAVRVFSLRWVLYDAQENRKLSSVPQGHEKWCRGLFEDTVFAVWQCQSDMLVLRRVIGLYNKNSKLYGPLLHAQTLMVYRHVEVSLFDTVVITTPVIVKTKLVIQPNEGSLARDASRHRLVIVMSALFSSRHQHGTFISSEVNLLRKTSQSSKTIRCDIMVRRTWFVDVWGSDHCENTSLCEQVGWLVDEVRVAGYMSMQQRWLPEGQWRERWCGVHCCLIWEWVSEVRHCSLFFG